MFGGRPAAAQPGDGQVTILHIDSSISGGPSASRQISAEIVNELTRRLPGAEVLRRDLELHQLSHLDSKMVAAVFADKDQADPATDVELARNEVVLQEFLSSDIVVIGAPMYNFTVPTQLKAWIDRIVIADRTFAYSESGSKGLAHGKKVIVASSRGGMYETGTPMASLDFQENYLRTVFRFIGIDEVEFVRAEGIALGPRLRMKAIEAAFLAVPGVVRRVAGSVMSFDSPVPSEALRVA